METLPHTLGCRRLAKCRINTSEKRPYPPWVYPGNTSTREQKKGPLVKVWSVLVSQTLPTVFLPPPQVLEDQQNIRLIRELLQTLYTSLCTLVQRVGKSVLVGNINMWVYRMETILHWQQQLNNIQITRVSRDQ